MRQEELQELQSNITEASAFAGRVKTEMSRIVSGQQELIDRLLLALIADGHVLLEGVPGLAKTLAVKTLAQTLNGSFARLQFTPDLLPADVIGTNIYNPQEHTFSVKKGPVFANIVLADEINRAPAKVQSALLECMQERQATIAYPPTPALWKHRRALRQQALQDELPDAPCVPRQSVLPPGSDSRLSV